MPSPQRLTRPSRQHKERRTIMKNYEIPMLEIIEVADIVTASPGTESPVVPDIEYEW